MTSVYLTFPLDITFCKTAIESTEAEVPRSSAPSQSVISRAMLEMPSNSVAERVAGGQLL